MQKVTDISRTRSMEEVGKRIRSIRERYKLTQDVFAERVLISRSLLSELENGKRAPADSLLAAMENFFSVDRKWVLTGKGYMMGHAEDGDKDDFGELIKGFNRLSKDGRKKLLHLLRVFLVVEETRQAANYSLR